MVSWDEEFIQVRFLYREHEGQYSYFQSQGKGKYLVGICEVF